MKTKETILKISELETSHDGCRIGDKTCIIESFFYKVQRKDLIYYRNLLIDENFDRIMNDEEMVRCIEAFFKNDLNVAETSKQTFLHRNTLLYRLDKIQSLTGLNIKKFNDAVTFRILMLIYESTK